MKTNPFLHGVAAIAYIGAVVAFLRFIESQRQNTPDTLLDGMAAISLFVFSAAVMAFLFFYHPLTLLLENKKAEAVSYFFKTLGSFGATALIVLVLASLQ